MGIVKSKVVLGIIKKQDNLNNFTIFYFTIIKGYF
jgi:hypothetical protein